jgi:hypothetical protein
MEKKQDKAPSCEKEKSDQQSSMTGATSRVEKSANVSSNVGQKRSSLAEKGKNDGNAMRKQNGYPKVLLNLNESSETMKAM